MNKIFNWRLNTVIIVTILSIYFVWPTLDYYLTIRSFPEELRDTPIDRLSGEDLEARLAFEERKKEKLADANMIRLGLDLQGGADFLLDVDTQALIDRKLVNSSEALRAELVNENVDARVAPDTDEGTITVVLENPERDINIARDVIERQSQHLEWGNINDLRGAEGLALRQARDQVSYDTREAIDAALKTVRRRVDEFGLTQPEVVKQGTNRIRVQIPGETDPERIAQNLLRTADLEFRMLHPQHDSVVTDFIQPGTFSRAYGTGIVRDEFLEEVPNPAAPGETMMVLKRAIPGVPPGYRLFLGEDTRIPQGGGQPIVTRNLAYLLTRDAPITGANLRRAAMFIDTMDIQSPYKVTLQFDTEGTEVFADITTDNVGRQFAIILDGTVMSAPVIRTPITGGRCEISGNFSQEEARDLSLVLKAGSLPAPLRIVESQAVEASLGADSVVDSGRALMIGGVVLVVMMIVIYRVAGLIAVLAMILNILLILAVLSMAGATLTLSGIGGILLTMGMAVDANVLIYERLREEMSEGKPMRAALNSAFGRAFTVILDSNITSLLPALVLILFEIVEGSIKGFWTALAIGLAVNLYTGLTVTRALIETWVLKFKSIDIGKIHLFKNSKFDFMRYRKIGYPISGSLLAVAIFYLVVHGVNPGIDFTGGVLATVEVTSTEEVPRSEIQRVMDSVPEFHDVKVVGVVNKDIYMVTVPKDNEDQDIAEIQRQLQRSLSESFGDKATVASSQVVESVVGQEFRVTAFLTIFVASLVILGYIAIRFRPIFGLAAVLALVHDLVITLGIFVLLGRSLTLDIVSGLLIILGYSVNDTIVVFDRIRETMSQSYGRSMRDMINEGINRTLARTVFTSGTTFITVLSMLVFGGVGLKDFALVLLLGIMAGTYSSIFVASALIDTYMLAKERREGIQKAHGKTKTVKLSGA